MLALRVRRCSGLDDSSSSVPNESLPENPFIFSTAFIVGRASDLTVIPLLDILVIGGCLLSKYKLEFGIMSFGL